MKVLLSLLIFLLAGFADAQNLEFRFIGNMAFIITDGKTTMFTDFPYGSGAFDYMKYDLNSIPIPENSLCLITHKHLDHWDSTLFRQIKKPKVIGPPDVVSGIDAARVIQFENLTTEYRGIKVEAIETPHAKVNHYSYLVSWHGLRMYFTGDTEETQALLNAKNLDVAFISPWLIRKLMKDGTGVDAKRIVAYHHTEGEQFPIPKNGLVPKQGDTFRIDFSPKDASAKAN
jgi:L-ascorbate metabolism protein UlaG (beta-lactamase superfamily)